MSGPYKRPFFSHGDGHYSPVNTDEDVYPKALYHAVPDAMGAGFARDFINWTAHLERGFSRGGDGEHRRDVEAAGLEACGPYGRELEAVVRGRYHEALEPCGIEPFEATWCEMNAVGFLEGDRFRWHTDHFQSSVNLRRETKGITFIYYAHQEPRPFSGGGLEFADGTLIEPDNDLLLFINPYQRHQVHRVRLFDGADPWRGGRWTLSGWLHRPESEVPDPTWHMEAGAPSNYVVQYAQAASAAGKDRGGRWRP